MTESTQYLCLIYEDEALMRQRSPEEIEAIKQAYRTFTERIVASGEYRAGEALASVSTATSVRVRQGQVMLTDGPFAETREHLGGFYLIACETLDRALEIAAEIPTSAAGTIEVRPLIAWDT